MNRILFLRALRQLSQGVVPHASPQFFFTVDHLGILGLCTFLARTSPFSNFAPKPGHFECHMLQRLSPFTLPDNEYNDMRMYCVLSYITNVCVCMSNSLRHCVASGTIGSLRMHWSRTKPDGLWCGQWYSQPTRSPRKLATARAARDERHADSTTAAPTPNLASPRYAPMPQQQLRSPLLLRAKVWAHPAHPRGWARFSLLPVRNRWSPRRIPRG